MKLVTFKTGKGEVKAGWLKGEGVVDMQLVSDGALPDNMLAFIDDHEKYFSIIKSSGLEDASPTDRLGEVKLLAPLPNPRSFRDYIGFEQHMLNASAKFGHKIGQGMVRNADLLFHQSPGYLRS